MLKKIIRFFKKPKKIFVFVQSGIVTDVVDKKGLAVHSFIIDMDVSVSGYCPVCSDERYEDDLCLVCGFDENAEEGFILSGLKACQKDDVDLR